MTSHSINIASNYEIKMSQNQQLRDIAYDFHVLQVEPSQLLKPENISKILTANNSLFTEVVKDGDLSKVVQIANAVLQVALEDTLMDSADKAKVVSLTKKKKKTFKLNQGL